MNDHSHNQSKSEGGDTPTQPSGVTRRDVLKRTGVPAAGSFALALECLERAASRATSLRAGHAVG
jgi:hypothetical protein